MEKLFNFIVAFAIVFVFYLIFVLLNKKKRAKIFETYGALIIKGKFKVSFENASKKVFALVMALADSFICATAYTIMRLFENVYVGFIVAALALIVLILAVYSLIGLFYKKKEGKKNV